MIIIIVDNCKQHFGQTNLNCFNIYMTILLKYRCCGHPLLWKIWKHFFYFCFKVLLGSFDFIITINTFSIFIGWFKNYLNRIKNEVSSDPCNVGVDTIVSVPQSDWRNDRQVISTISFTTFINLCSYLLISDVVNPLTGWLKFTPSKYLYLHSYIVSPFLHNLQILILYLILLSVSYSFICPLFHLVQESRCITWQLSSV